MNFASHPLVTTLKSLQGNARGAVLTEPLWGIPYNLYAPYVSIYMLSFGLSDTQIGLVTSIGLAGQLVLALLRVVIIRKLYLQRSTLM